MSRTIATKTTGALGGLLCALALTAPGAAAALTPPGVATGPATHVSYGAAVLEGTVNPKGSETFYYFQYGPTRAYGLQTGLHAAGAGRANEHVSVLVTGLQPLTRYHFRLVAVNNAGPGVGGDKAFMTPKVPLSLAILASPNPVVYGGVVTVQGTLSGTGNGNREVVLQANTFPYTAGFVNVGNPELTSASGGFTFNVVGVAAATQYRVVAVTRPPVASPVASELVAANVSAHVRRLHGRVVKGRRPVRFFGTVSPALDGMQVAIMRIVHGQNVLVGGMLLGHRNATSSSFSRRMRVRRGIYRIYVRITNGALVPTFSAPVVVR